MNDAEAAIGISIWSKVAGPGRTRSLVSSKCALWSVLPPHSSKL